MACDYRCPWCGIEIEDPDYWEMQPEVDYTVECSDCEREFEVSLYLDPVFSVKIPEKLKDCCCDCDVWDGTEDCCRWKDKEEIERKNAMRGHLNLAPVRPIAGCPLGYAEEKLGGDA